MTRATDDEIFEKAKKKLSTAIAKVDTKAEGGVADLVKLCETLATMREVELKAQEGSYGGALGGAGGTD